MNWFVNSNMAVFCDIAAGQKPGFVPVKVFTQDGSFLGETKILYLHKDSDKQILQKVVHTKKLQRILFQEFAHSHENVGQNISSLPSTSSVGKWFGFTFYI